MVVPADGEDVRASGGPAADPGAPVQWRRPLPRLPWWLAVTAVVLVLLSIGLPNVAPGVDFLAAPGSPVRRFFGVAGEMNLPTFFSVVVTLGASAAQVLVGRLVGGRVGLAFLVSAGLLALMAFDDFTALHERLDSIGEAWVPPGTTGYLWVLPGLFPAAVVLAALAHLARSLRGPARRDVVLGIVLVLGAALGLETLNGVLDRPGTDGVPLQIGTHVEELTEVLGLVLLLRGSLSVLEVRRRSRGLCLRVAGRALARAARPQPVAQT
ncbi:hypothetical protein SAMN05660464_0277 [Geodermatophilus dictyosporus]|uniref:Uncharacterized protein n=1 Tax=Geodermatophilus dictyosporus TaxID=1523247 RepID=A0A1I5UJY9_9ACTN|nr:hypothetical protein [Geodermatophilus dictyosporus]SFP95593.1 hypothetical protein SAMN05660464_0277 [Geodermatophilus dictyosporus]